jgi:hypothetical protein
MIKQRRATDKFLVAIALEVFGGQVGGVVLGGNRRDLVARLLVGIGGGPQHSIEFENALRRAIKVCWDVVLT